MKVYKLSLAAGFCVALSTGAMANDADFRLVNKTGYQIDSVFVGPHSSDSWGADIMGKDALGDGEAVNITFPHGGKNCHYDLKVKYNTGEEAMWNDVDLCQYDKITIVWDGKNTRAIGE